MASNAGKNVLSILRKSIEHSKTTGSFHKFIEKLNITALGDGKCTAELKISQEHTNSTEHLHGGLSATLVDVVSNWALLSGQKKLAPVVSVDLHTTHIEGAKLGDEIVVEADTVREGKRLAFLKVEIRNKGNGDLLLTGSHAVYVLRHTNYSFEV